MFNKFRKLFASPTQSESIFKRISGKSTVETRSEIETVSEQDSPFKTEFDKHVLPLLETKTNCKVAETVCGNPIHRDSLRRLRPECWLNDELINGYVELINQSQGKSLVQSSFFFEKLKDQSRTGNFKPLHRWLNKSLKTHNIASLWQLDQMLIPVNVTNSHWFLLVADLRSLTYTIVDSMNHSE